MSISAPAVFRAVYERRSFSHAARELGLDSSVVSRRVRGLEERLGVALFFRTTRTVRPTEAGERYYERVAPALDALAEAELEVAGGSSLRGRLRIAAPGALGRHRVAPVARCFAQEHPGVDIHLFFSDRRLDLVAEGIDLAVRVGEPREAGLVVRRLGVSPQVLVAAPSYLRAHAPLDGGTLAALAGHSVVLRMEDGRLLDVRSRLPPALRAQVRLGMACDELDTTVDAVLHGLGLAMLPRWRVEAELATGALEQVDLGLPDFAAPLYAALPAGRQTTRRARAFLEQLVAALQ